MKIRFASVDPHNVFPAPNSFGALNLAELGASFSEFIRTLAFCVVACALMLFGLVCVSLLILFSWFLWKPAGIVMAIIVVSFLVVTIDE